MNKPRTFDFFIDSALRGCTSTTEHRLSKKPDAPIHPVCCPHPEKESHVVFVDTPGLGDVKAENNRTFDVIRAWLKQTLRRDVRLRGVLYCISVSTHSTQIPAVKVMTFLSELFGDGISKNVVLALTMDADTRFDVTEEALPKFIRDSWSYSFNAGLRTVRFHETYESAWRIFSLLEQSTPQTLIRLSRASSSSSLVTCYPEAHLKDTEVPALLVPPVASHAGPPEATHDPRLRATSFGSALLPGPLMGSPSLQRIRSRPSFASLVIRTRQHSWVSLPDLLNGNHTDRVPTIPRTFQSHRVSRSLSAPLPIVGPTSLFPPPVHLHASIPSRPTTPAIPIVPPEGIVDSEAWQFFIEEFKDAARCISATELQKVFYRRDIPKLTLDTVEMLINAFNIDRHSLIPLLVFQRVWIYLRERLNIFKQFEREIADESVGNIFAQALHKSEVGAGYGLSSITASLMEARYASEFSPDGQRISRLSFDRFLQASLLLRLVTNSFKSVDEDGDGWVKVNFDQVMKVVLNALNLVT